MDEQQNNGQDEHPELAEHKRQLDRIAASIEAMAERSRPKLVRSSMTIAQKCQYIREHGSEAFLALPAGEPRR